MPTHNLISIIIPTYNYGSRITQALLSIQNQNDNHIEILIIDDGSTDQTKDVICAFQTLHSNLNLHYYYQTNKGASYSRNKGIDIARGKYLLFLDADDYLLPNALLRFRHAIVKNPHADMIAAGSATFAEKTQIIKQQPFTKKLSNSPEINFKHYLRKKISLHQGSCLYKKQVFARIRYPETIKNAEDVSVFFHVLATQQCVSMHYPVVMINKHHGSLRHQFALHKNTGLDIVNLIFDKSVLPKKYFKYRKEYISVRYLSLSRIAYRHKEYKLAAKYFEKAICVFPPYILKIAYVKKYIAAQMQLLFNNAKVIFSP
jgi:glycosyltransferase involved in cell wall biosynthesis